MISGFDELLEMMAEERRRRMEQQLPSAPAYRLDERGAIVLDAKPPRKPLHPLERT